MSTYFAKLSKPSGGEHVSIALYVACAIVQLSGLAAVAYQLGESNFTLFTMGLTLVGTAVSYYMRSVGTTTRILKLGAMLLALVFVYALRRSTLFEVLIPPDSNTSPEMLLVCALAFTATFGSFLLITDDAVIFTCVWTIAIIGLTGTVNINRELPICFVVFLAAASFVLVHQNAIAFGVDPKNTVRSSESASARWRLLRTHILMAVAAWGASILLGALIAIPVQMVGRNMSLGTIIQRLQVPSGPLNHSGGSNKLIFDRRDEFNIGLGPVDDDPVERLTVLSDGPHYWRGRTYSSYTGHGWRSVDLNSMHFVSAKSPTPDSSGQYTYDLTATLKPVEPLRKTEQIVSLMEPNGGLIGPLFHAAEPIALRIPVPQILAHDDGTISAGRGGETNSYEVTSAVSVAKPSDLRMSSVHYPSRIAQEYLAIERPNDAVEALEEEAILSTPGNPYDRAGAIKRYITKRCTYTHEARAVPADGDAVEFFLNESKEGYCDLYATAMVVLCRYAGIPARVVTGFAPGTATSRADDPQPPARDDHRVKYVLRGDDLHAWAEVYFTGYGWIVFDPTEDTAGVAIVAKTPEPTPKENRWLQLFSKEKIPLASTVLALGAMAFVVANELKSRIRGRNFVARVAGGKTISKEQADVIRIYFDALKYLARKSAVRRTMTMATGEYADLVTDKFGINVGDNLKTITELAQQAMYAGSGSRQSVSGTDVEKAKQSFTALRAAFKQRRREKGRSDSANST